MKKTLLTLITVFSFGSIATAGSRYECPIKQTPESYLTEKKMNEMTECMKDKSCSNLDRNFICPWAFEKQREQKSNPNTPEDEKELVEQTCAQCEALKKISCAYDLREANKEFLQMAQIFVADNDPKKPLIFGFDKPSPKVNNFNLNANMEKLLADNLLYNQEFKALTDKLSPLSLNVTTQDQVRANVKKALDLTSSFEQKWSQFHKDSEQLSAIVDDLYFYMFDWQGRIQSLQREPLCSGIVEKLNLASTQGSDFLSKLNSANNTLQSMSFSKRLRLTEEFAIKSIKQSYLQASKKTLEDLQASLGSVLLLDQEVNKSNLWWIELNRGGLIGGLHTNYYQFESAMQKLLQALGDGKDYLDTLKSIKGLSTAVLNTAIRNQQLRIDEIQGDIDWLKSRGWEGQFASQKDIATTMFASQTDKTSLCATSLQTFLTAAAVALDYDAFHSTAEVNYMQAIKVCEAN